MYNINDYVVYQYWVCKITDITKLDYSDMGFDKDNTYYIMNSLFEKETFYIPTQNQASIRKPLTKKQAIELIDLMPNITPISKAIDEEYRNEIHHYNCYSYSKILKTVHQKSEALNKIGKRLSIVDSKYQHTAEKYLFDELSFALNIEPKMVDNYIKRRISVNN